MSKEHPLRNFKITFPFSNGYYAFSYQESFKVDAVSIFGPSATLELSELNGKISFRVLARFMEKIADARHEPTIEEGLTSSFTADRGAALQNKKLLDDIENLPIPTKQQMEEYYNSP